MKIVALSAGSTGGNTELILLTALRAAQAAVPSASITIIRLNELSIGNTMIAGQIPHPFSNDKSQGDAGGKQPATEEPKSDDRSFVLEHILEADAILIGAPLYSRSVSWLVKWFQDKTLGPGQDIELAKMMLRMGKGHLVDQRIFKPRVAALLALGGALGTEWTAFGLPILHQVFFPMGIKIVDQMQVYGAGLPGCVVLDEEALARAEALGRNMVEQACKSPDERSYVGPEGMCPICHLNMVVFTSLKSNQIDCATCGAKGTAVANKDGKIELVFDSEGLDYSVFTLKGLELHGKEVGQVAAKLKPQMGQVAPKKEELMEWGRKSIAVPPSLESK